MMGRASFESLAALPISALVFDSATSSFFGRGGSLGAKMIQIIIQSEIANSNLFSDPSIGRPYNLWNIYSTFE
jgi:hypothetical protein